MRIIEFQKSYGSKMLRRLLPIAIFGLVILAIVAVSLFFIPSFPDFRQYGFGIILFVLMIFAFVKRNLESILDEIRSFRDGEDGERAVMDILKGTLDNNYLYISNYVIPNTRIGDIDGLLVCPKGIIIVEVKNYKGVFRVSGGDMLRRLRGDIYKLYRKSPFAQVSRQKNFLEKYLKEREIDVKVSPVVALVGGKISSIAGETKVFITEVNNLTNHIFNLSPIKDWSLQMESRIVGVLGVKSDGDLQ